MVGAVAVIVGVLVVVAAAVGVGERGMVETGHGHRLAVALVPISCPPPGGFLGPHAAGGVDC
jgi:hypothetical protein